jgi:integrase
MAQIKDKKTGSWSFYGTLTDVVGNKHRYHKRGYKTKKEAKAAENIYRITHSNMRESITLNELVGIYHEDFPSLAIKEVTLITDEGYYKNHIKEYLGDVQLKDINTPMVHDFINKLAQKKMPNGELYSVSTINHTKNVLSKYLKYAIVLGYLEYNPCHNVSSFKRAEEIKEEKIVFWELETFNYFISCVDDEYWRLVFMFLFWTGVREGELFALQWKDVDLGKGTAKIYKTVTSKTNLGHYKITSPKNDHSNRIIDLQDTLILALRKRFKDVKKKDGFTLEWFVFGLISPLSRSQLARFLDYYIELAGVPRITPHGFRHSHASLLISRRVDDEMIADRLGHTVYILHKTYAHIYKSMRQDMKSILNEIS